LRRFFWGISASRERDMRAREKVVVEIVSIMISCSCPTVSQRISANFLIRGIHCWSIDPCSPNCRIPIISGDARPSLLRVYFSLSRSMLSSDDCYQAPLSLPAQYSCKLFTVFTANFCGKTALPVFIPLSL
jgi:hypothetical protein